MAVIGVTGKLELNTTGSTWVEIAKCKSISFPDFSTTAVDITNLASPDYAKEYVPGMVDAGSVTFQCEYTSATYVQLTGLVRTTKNWRITSPTGVADVVQFSGFLTKVALAMSPDEEMVIDAELRTSGLPEVTPAA